MIFILLFQLHLLHIHLAKLKVRVILCFPLHERSRLRMLYSFSLHPYTYSLICFVLLAPSVEPKISPSGSSQRSPKTPLLPPLRALPPPPPHTGGSTFLLNCICYLSAKLTECYLYRLCAPDLHRAISLWSP